MGQKRNPHATRDGVTVGAESEHRRPSAGGLDDWDHHAPVEVTTKGTDRDIASMDHVMKFRPGAFRARSSMDNRSRASHTAHPLETEGMQPWRRTLA